MPVSNTEIKIFVSYRRADSPCFAERIRDWFRGYSPTFDDVEEPL